jgi:Domain of unknown function (DUF4124)
MCRINRTTDTRIFSLLPDCLSRIAYFWHQNGRINAFVGMNLRQEAFTINVLDRSDPILLRAYSFCSGISLYCIQIEYQAHVVGDCEGGQQIECLIDKTDMFASEKGAIAFRHRGDQLSVDLYLAIIGYIDAADEVQEGGFAGAAASSQRHFLATDKCCVERLQDGMQLLTFMEAASQIGQANVAIGRHTLVGICWDQSSFNTLDQECPLFRCQQRFQAKTVPGTPSRRERMQPVRQFLVKNMSHAGILGRSVIMMRIPILTVAALLLLSTWTTTATASEIYQWTDEDGVVHFSDTTPENGAVVTTLRVQATNPAEYDPTEDPYSIRNQATRTNSSWTELEKAREERQEKRREEAEQNLRYAPAPYDPYLYYSRPAYYPFIHPGRHLRHQPKLARRQHQALEELGLTGPRPYSINSGAHHARVLRSRDLPIVTPKPGHHRMAPQR